MKLSTLINRAIKQNKIQYYNRSKYLEAIEKRGIEEEMILLESQQGNNLNGNIFYILKELSHNEKFRNYKIMISVQRKERYHFQRLINQYHLKGELICIYSKRYIQILASAKYLITDTSLSPDFIKKENQIMLNVWHGTPLKTLGRRDEGGIHSLGNVQKNFILSDYLLYPSEYMMKHMVEDYMLQEICKAKCVISGYPRNEVFFDDKNEKIINDYHLQNKQVIAYMPTWRGFIGKINQKHEIEILHHHLQEMEEKLTDNQILLINLHPFLKDEIDYKKYTKILSFPEQFETYEVLNICDILITDYSSVFFDFANTKRKIILFTYDLNQYIKERGLYLNMLELPFPKVDNTNELIKEINREGIDDYSHFNKIYCDNDGKGSTTKLLSLLLLDERSNLNIKELEKNGKENILIYTGNLAKNGITTALFHLLNAIEPEKYNYYLTFYTRKVAPYKEVLKKLPHNISYLPMLGKMNASILDKLYLMIIKKTKRSIHLNTKRLNRLYEYEIKRCFDDISFQHVVHYSGYEFKVQQLFGRFKCKRSIFVHNNMKEEIKLKRNQNANSLRYAYHDYDKVVIVTEDMREPTLYYCDEPNKIIIANNIIDYQNIIEKSKNKIEFDDFTESTIEIDELKHVLNSSNKKFITIGRFAPEKGHIRLLNAFDKLWRNNPSINLIIIGGYGPLYEETCKHIETLKSKDNIILIKAVSNPYPILKRCDYFILSSFHEGFGLVLAEADILGLPVVSTDILGPRNFMKEHHGFLVENSQKGIYVGLCQLLSDRIQPLNVDYQKYNEKAIADFEKIISE